MKPSGARKGGSHERHALGATIVGCFLRRSYDNHDAFAEWVREVKEHNPDYEPTDIMGPQGRYVPNPKWRPGQIIRHANGTETHS
jgi:hypothetical protein